MSLYPLQFKPIIKRKIWGGNKLKTVLNKTSFLDEEIGESWEISGLNGDISVVANGMLAENNLQELIEVYMGDLVGDRIYQQFGVEFPLLIKFIDTNEKLSLQVHPDDALAKERHKAFGKTEMWYLLDADPNSELLIGFNQPIDKKSYLEKASKNKIEEILNKEEAQKGNCFFIPSGKVHAIGGGILLAEIQQASDITYRIHDWGRVDKQGNARELHQELAVDAIDYDFEKKLRIDYKAKMNESKTLVRCPYFTGNILVCNTEIEKNYAQLDSFVIYMCIEGSFEMEDENKTRTSVKKGETVLIPALLEQISITPQKTARILEIYID